MLGVSCCSPGCGVMMSVFHVVEGVSALVWGGVNQSCECGAGFRERESLLRSLERARGVLCGENRVSVRGSLAGNGGEDGLRSERYPGLLWGSVWRSRWSAPAEPMRGFRCDERTARIWDRFLASI